MNSVDRLFLISFASHQTSSETRGSQFPFTRLHFSIRLPSSSYTSSSNALTILRHLTHRDTFIVIVLMPYTLCPHLRYPQFKHKERAYHLVSGCSFSTLYKIPSLDVCFNNISINFSISPYVLLYIAGVLISSSPSL